MPIANRYVLNQKALDGLLDIRDKYGHSMLAKAMRIDNSTLRRILRGKPFYISTGLVIAKALCKKDGDIPLHCVFHEWKEDMQS